MSQSDPSADFYSDAPPAGPQELTLPHSIEAEQAILGGLMLDASSFDAVAEVVGKRIIFAPPIKSLPHHVASVGARAAH